jgi:isopentenyl diphosphate isomerase/L-lactate dehydrogenase-like FMN-dependent dehydrogenase
VNDLLDLTARQVAADLRAAPAAARRRFSMDARAERCRTIEDLRALAKRTIPKPVFDYVDGAANDEVTYRRNRAGFEDVELKPRALVDVSDIELKTTVLGREVALPILAPPTGLTGLIHPDGEVAVARAAHRAGSLYTLSTLSSRSIEEVHAEAPGRKWFQLYVLKDRGLVWDMLARAQANGYETLMLTVDVAVAGVRERDVRNRFSVPPRLTLRTLLDGLAHPRWSANFVAQPRISPGNFMRKGDPASLASYVNRQFDPSVTWDDIASFREHWDGPIVIKGIMRADDAALAVEHGIEGIAVSNHGGRQLDHAQSTIGALPAIAEAVDGRAEIYLDSGVRRGTDIIKALALGARAVLVGRPLVYGLGAAGEAGVSRAFDLLRGELATAMALAGYPKVSEIGPDAVT